MNIVQEIGASAEKVAERYEEYIAGGMSVSSALTLCYMEGAAAGVGAAVLTNEAAADKFAGASVDV